MENSFYDFWRLYAPLHEYRNRYRACETLWNDMDDLRRRRILYHLQTEQSPSGDAKQHTANPYFSPPLFLRQNAVLPQAIHAEGR